MFDRDYEAELDDSEYPEEPNDDDDDTIPCPHCGLSVYEEAERCLYCGHYLSVEDAPRRYPWWFVLGFLLSMVVVLGWIWRW
ncbi:zinc ribbon domain-containing protein [Singulisphaera acidiphila]|uniref:Zinc-ribbon domain-containing protein n=1 Tax=Singulisphaera acidiphila (strain ATCC BAA-1392 / DSM 18658 / VKM B-2454 / MOB10) TaxID=886293 RepID=L0D6A8_SINAD|nr:zinc ribbon domain-containing protein [Singulisphaera acidiphila]AGA24929.1 hypothetical protein Sinac_0494 [Singulisphaera acidiphila DSM 18658]